MTLGIAIETSGRLGSVALTEDGNVIAEDSFAHGLRHAAEMVPRIDALFKSRGWNPPDAREIYVSAGPGSFTGLRIGITLSKTLAFATGARIVAVPSVEVLARNAPPDVHNVVIALDAKRDQIFTARLRRAGERDAWTIEEPAHLDTLLEMVRRAPRPLYLIGEGLPFHSKFLADADPGITLAPEESWRARAAAVAGVGWRMARDGQFTDADALVPIYIRIPDAQEKHERQSRQNALGT